MNNSDNPRKPVSAEKALERLENLCARSERSTHELRLKLRLWKIDSDDAEKIIESLKRRRFVDDQRYTHAFIKDKFLLSHWGRIKIKIALRSQSIPAEFIDSAMDELIDEEIYKKNLLEFIADRSKRLGAEASGYEGRTRIYRAAVARGYEPALISTVFRSFLSK